MLALKVFQATGGIEKVCRILGKALYEDASIKGKKFQVLSMYDHTIEADNNTYFPAELFRGYGRNKVFFVFSSLWHARLCDTIILSHINLTPIGWLIRLLFPRKKVILLAHGIEIWGSLSFFRRKILKACSLVCSVSSFTRDKILEMHKLDKSRNIVLNNCIDPFLPDGREFHRTGRLREKLNLSDDDIVLFTLTRISSRDRYKGYNLVISCLPDLIKDNPGIKYVVGGSYDEDEKAYIENLATGLGVADRLILPGFIPEKELVEYFKMSDIYIMPSIKEGFGIVFIEAMNYGLSVIAGNRDGSVDALLHGELGLLVDPQDISSVETAISEMISRKSAYLPDRKKLLDKFSYDTYKKNIEKILAA